MDKKLVYSGIAAALMTLAAPAQAVTTLNLTGEGTIYTFNADGSRDLTYSGAFTGVVTREVFGSPEFSNGSTYAYGNSWVHSTYQFTWDTGSYSQSGMLLPSELEVAWVYNDYVPNQYVTNYSDMLYTHRTYNPVVETSWGSIKRVAVSTLESKTLDTSWLSSLDFLEERGLSGYHDHSDFTDVSFDWSNETMSDSNWRGFSASVNWRTAEVTTSVPEPGTMTLMGLGMLGLGIARRRRNA